MPPPKDPIKYAEYIKRQSESHIGKPSGMLGKNHTGDAILKMRQAKEGKYIGGNNPFYRKKHSKETINKIKLSAQNRPDSWYDRLRNHMRGKVPWNKGIPVTESTRMKLSESQKGKKGNRFGKHHTKEAKEKIGNTHRGKPKSEDQIKKISANRIGKCCKEQNPNWNGGISYIPYCFLFNERRRIAVRIFFGNKCICCSKEVSKNITLNGSQKELSVHHVDHDKEQGCNGKPFNLVPLCINCHSKELHHQQEYKININKILEEGFETGIWSKEQYECKVMYP